MEANELRIGNYYWSGYNLKISKLMGFIPEESGYEIEGIPFTGYLIEGCDKLIPWGSLDPIPLTEEWLLNFGFKLENNAYWNENVSILGLENDRYIHFDGGRVFVRTVHQLQNLFFALKGKELTLKY